MDQIKSVVKSNVLEHLCETIKKEPFKIPLIKSEMKNYSYSMDEKIDHNAGFDSYMTGICFLTLMNYLNIEPNELNPANEKLSNYINKIFCLRLEEVGYIDLTGIER